MHIFSRLCMLLCLSGAAWATDDVPLTEEGSSIAERSTFMPGFMPLYWDADEGRLYGDIAGLQSPFIYYNGLSQGVGSNDLGLDRGRLADTHLVTLDQVGKKVFLTAVNTKYRARSDNAAERRAVDEAFAQSIIWGFEVAEQSEGMTLIDLTDFALSDATDLSRLLSAARSPPCRSSDTHPHPASSAARDGWRRCLRQVREDWKACRACCWIDDRSTQGRSTHGQRLIVISIAS